MCLIEGHISFLLSSWKKKITFKPQLLSSFSTLFNTITFVTQVSHHHCQSSKSLLTKLNVASYHSLTQLFLRYSRITIQLQKSKVDDDILPPQLSWLQPSLLLPHHRVINKISSEICRRTVTQSVTIKLSGWFLFEWIWWCVYCYISRWWWRGNNDISEVCRGL